jgi:enamidase
LAVGVVLLAGVQAGAAWVRAAEPARSYLAVVGGTLIDGTGAPPVPDSAIIIEGDRIRAAGPRRQVRIPPGSVPLDATDLTVIPGLIDMHAHLIKGLDFGEFLEHGITSVRHLGDTSLGWITGLESRVERGKEDGPRIFHCGLFVVSRPPFDPTVYSRASQATFAVMKGPEDAGRVVRKLLESGADVIKVKTEMAPESLRALGAAAAEARIPISFDNGVGFDSYDALIALEAGARGVEHLSGIDFEDQEEVETVLEKMLEVRAFAVPTLKVVSRTYSADRVAARETFVRRFAERGGLVVAGTDVPTGGIVVGSSLHDELQLLVAAGLTPAQALVAATGGAARALGYQGLVGTIEAGAYADFVLVYGSPAERITDTGKIFSVFKGGEQVFPAQ